jgi:hypothetical protein
MLDLDIASPQKDIKEGLLKQNFSRCLLDMGKRDI